MHVILIYNSVSLRKSPKVYFSSCNHIDMSNSLSIPSELNDSFNDLISSSSSTNWIMFTYDKGTNNLKLHSSGTKGLPELEEEFDQGKVQYAFARVIEEQSNLTKLAMISWVIHFHAC